MHLQAVEEKKNFFGYRWSARVMFVVADASPFSAHEWTHGSVVQRVLDLSSTFNSDFSPGEKWPFDE